MKGQPGRQPAKGGKMEVLLRMLRTLNVWRSQLFMHEACASKPLRSARSPYCAKTKRHSFRGVYSHFTTYDMITRGFRALLPS